MKAARASATAVAALVLSALAAGPTWAGEPTAQLRARIDRVLQILDNEDMPRDERRVAVRAIVTEIFDVKEISKRALGHHWQDRTPVEQREFTQLFGDLLERACFSRLDLYGGHRVLYLGDSIDGDLASVRTKIVSRDETGIDVHYRMMLRGDQWVGYDVSITGLSLVASYRQQFNRIIQTSSYGELVKQLRTRQDDQQPRQTSQK